MACGIGNLEYYINEKYHKYLYMSTIDENDIKHIKEKFNNACIFQYDYLNDDIVNDDFQYNKLPEKLKNDLHNENIKWIIFINPPYATSQVAGTNSKSKKNVSASKIRDMMHKEKLGDALKKLLHSLCIGYIKSLIIFLKALKFIWQYSLKLII